MKKEKDFEVLISPTDVLAQELEEVLGGSGKTCDTQCKKKSALFVFPAQSDADCPEGFHVVDGYCIEIE